MQLAGFDVQEPDRFKNSDLKSKCHSVTVRVKDGSAYVAILVMLSHWY